MSEEIVKVLLGLGVVQCAMHIQRSSKILWWVWELGVGFGHLENFPWEPLVGGPQLPGSDRMGLGTPAAAVLLSDFLRFP